MRSSASALSLSPDPFPDSPTDPLASLRKSVPSRGPCRRPLSRFVPRSPFLAPDPLPQGTKYRQWLVCMLLIKRAPPPGHPPSWRIDHWVVSHASASSAPPLMSLLLPLTFGCSYLPSPESRLKRRHARAFGRSSLTSAANNTYAIQIHLT